MTYIYFLLIHLENTEINHVLLLLIKHDIIFNINSEKTVVCLFFIINLLYVFQYLKVNVYVLSL